MRFRLQFTVLEARENPTGPAPVEDPVGGGDPRPDTSPPAQTTPVPPDTTTTPGPTDPGTGPRT